MASFSFWAWQSCWRVLSFQAQRHPAIARGQLLWSHQVLTSKHSMTSVPVFIKRKLYKSREKMGRGWKRVYLVLQQVHLRRKTIQMNSNFSYETFVHSGLRQVNQMAARIRPLESSSLGPVRNVSRSQDTETNLTKLKHKLQHRYSRRTPTLRYIASTWKKESKGQGALANAIFSLQQIGMGKKILPA